MLAPSISAASGEPPAVTFVRRFDALAERYDLLLCDIWGVVHDGLDAFPTTAATLTRFREGGGHVVLVSNAPRPGVVVAEQLDGLRVPRAAYDTVITSGDLTRRLIAARAGERMHFLGPDRDLPLIAGLDAERVELDRADYVVCSGLVDDVTETVADYRPTLEAMRARALPMICANPDILVERGTALVPCAGALAAAYEEIGGTAITAGKPHRPIYEAALALGDELAGRPIARGRVLGIGDAIRTDIAGARGIGIDCVLVGARGIHAAELGLTGRDEEDDLSVAMSWIDAQPVRPTFLMSELRW